MHADSASPRNCAGPEPQAAGIFRDLVRSRRSCRAYAPDRPVPEQTLLACLEAARLAPSACNKQPWRFVVIRAPERRRELCRHGLLPGLRRDWIEAAPVLVVLAAERELITHRLAPGVSGIPYWLLDLGIAGEHFVLAAAAHGLGTCWIGWIREKGIRKVIRAPRSVRIVALFTVGYPAEPLPPPRPRRPLAEIVAFEQWDRSDPDRQA